MGEVINNKPSHRLFQVAPSYPLSQSIPTKRKRKKFKKLMADIGEKLTQQTLGIPMEQPIEQSSKGRNAKRHVYKRAKRQEQN